MAKRSPGDFEDEIDVGLGSMDPTTAQAALVAKLDANGQAIWAKGYGITGKASGGSVSSASDGTVAVGGWFEGEIDLSFGQVTGMGPYHEGFALLLQP